MFNFIEFIVRHLSCLELWIAISLRTICVYLSKFKSFISSKIEGTTLSNSLRFKIACSLFRWRFIRFLINYFLIKRSSSECVISTLIFFVTYIFSDCFMSEFCIRFWQIELFKLNWLLLFNFRHEWILHYFLIKRCCFKFICLWMLIWDFISTGYLKISL
jgi:hypothetical protein